MMPQPKHPTLTEVAANSKKGNSPEDHRERSHFKPSALQEEDKQRLKSCAASKHIPLV